jgi:hypothetical protein
MNTKKLLIAIFSIAFVFLAVATVIPSPEAHRISSLGYKSLCSFAPISTAILLVLSAPGITYLVAKRASKEARA